MPRGLRDRNPGRARRAGAPDDRDAVAEPTQVRRGGVDRGGVEAGGQDAGGESAGGGAEAREADTADSAIQDLRHGFPDIIFFFPFWCGLVRSVRRDEGGANRVSNGQ